MCQPPHQKSILPKSQTCIFAVWLGILSHGSKTKLIGIQAARLQAPSNRSKPMKKIIIRLAVILVLLLLAVLVIGFLSLNSIIKKGVETVGPQVTKVEVRLGSAKLLPFSGSGQLSELFVGNPAGFKTSSAIKMSEIAVSLKPASLFSDTVVIDELKIQAPEITFEGSLSGSNLSQIMNNIEGSATNETQPKSEKKSEKKFLVKDVVIQGGKINLSATLLGGKAMTVPLPEVHLQNIGTGGSGVSAAELAKQIMVPVLASVTKVVSGAIGNIGQEVKELGKGVKEVGKGATEQIDKAAKGLKDLFKRK